MKLVYEQTELDARLLSLATTRKHISALYDKATREQKVNMPLIHELYLAVTEFKEFLLYVRDTAGALAKLAAMNEMTEDEMTADLKKIKVQITGILDAMDSEVPKWTNTTTGQSWWEYVCCTGGEQKVRYVYVTDMPMTFAGVLDFLETF